MCQATSHGETIGLGSDKQQIQEGILRLQGAGKRGSHRNSLFKKLAVAGIAKSVENQSMADKVFILKLLYNGSACFCPAFPNGYDARRPPGR